MIDIRFEDRKKVNFIREQFFVFASSIALIDKLAGELVGERLTSEPDGITLPAIVFSSLKHQASNFIGS